MFDLEKREKFILLVLLTILIVGLCFGLYQKRSVYVEVKPDSFTPLEEPAGSLTGFTYPADDVSTETIKININSSDSSGLMKIKGVGKTLADRIVEYRSVHGNFVTLEDLKKVKGVGQKLYGKIKDEVSID